jgi:TetR/AcrR family transcriptional repressor of nem operon
MIDGSRGPQGRHGCFLVNSALEVAPKDSEAARIVRNGFRDMEQFFAKLIRQGKQAGEFRKDVDAVDSGRTLMNQLIGLMVLVRAGAPKPVLRSVVQQAQKLLL